jgi:hypothetical protein
LSDALSSKMHGVAILGLAPAAVGRKISRWKMNILRCVQNHSE